MNTDRLKEILDKIPITVLLGVFLLYLGYDYYSFTTDAQSPLMMKQRDIEASREEIKKLQDKVKAANEFLKNLELKKNELRSLASELENMKATLSESLDVPDFMKSVITESRKVGLFVLSLKPAESSAKEYYAEQAFDLTFRGVYVQLLVFLERLSNLTKIVRIDDLAIKPNSSSLSRYVELEGIVRLKVYRYVGSRADSIAKGDFTVAKPNPPGKGGSPGRPAANNTPAQPPKPAHPEDGL